MAVPAGRKTNTFGRQTAPNEEGDKDTIDREPNGEVMFRSSIKSIASPQMASMGARQGVADPSENGIRSGDARGTSEGDQVDMTLRRDEPKTTNRTGGASGKD